MTSIHLLAGICSSSHWESRCKPPRTATTDDINQPPTLLICTICWPTEIAEQLHAHIDTARFIAKLHQAALMWNNQLTHARATIKLGLEAAEALPAGSDQPRLCWRSLNRRRTGIGHAKTNMRIRGYIDNTQSVNCDSSEPQT